MVRLARFSSSDDGPIDRDLGWDRGFQQEDDLDDLPNEKPDRTCKKRSPRLREDERDCPPDHDAAA